MKRCLLYGLLFLQVMVYAQKNDHLWTMGYICSATSPPPPEFWLCGINNIAFDSTLVNIYREFRTISVQMGGGGANDKYGELQFYTNGFKIHNRNDQMMPNGGGLSPGVLGNDYIGVIGGSYPNLHGSMVISKPENDSVYYLLHGGWEYGTSNSSYCNYLYYTIVDMRLYGGLGDVTDKNHVLVNDTLIGGSGMAVCKHANGRDWWIIMQQMFSNCFYKFLLTPYGIDTVGMQCIGDTLHYDLNRGSNVFTPDGGKYIWSNPYEHLNILDFDRCTGEFSRHRRFGIIDSLPKLEGGGSVYLDGVAVSPNSKYLYLSTISEVRQFDLTASDILQSEVIITNTLVDSPHTSVCFSQLAPNGKIYLVAAAQDTFLHVISYPDSAGMACGFVKNGLRLPSYNHTYLPNYPNYRLGALAGSSCDSLLHVGIEEIDEAIKPEFSLYPNPTNHTVTLTHTGVKQKALTVKFYNLRGQLLEQFELNTENGISSYDLGKYSSAIVVIRVTGDGENLFTKRITVIQ